MLIALLRNIRGGVVWVAGAVLAVPAGVFAGEKQAQDESERTGAEEHSGADPHALREHGRLLRGEQASAQQGTALADHAENGQTDAPLGGRPLVVGHPGEGQRDGGEDARADQERGEEAYRVRCDKRQDNVAGTAQAGKKGDEDGALAEVVGEETGADAAEQGGKIGDGGEALGLRLSIPHVGQDCGEVGRERAERGVEAEDNRRLQIVLVVLERREGLLKIDPLFLVPAPAEDCPLADNQVLPLSEERTFERTVGKVEVGNHGKDQGRYSLCE